MALINRAAWIGSLFLASSALAATPGIDFFEKEVRPVLVKHCYKCHAADAKKVKGGLLLDTKSGWSIGGDSGPAVIPGDIEKSLLIRGITHKDNDLKMPPKYRMKPSEIDALRQWVKMGAPDPRTSGPSKKKIEEIDLAKGRDFWSFKARARPKPPVVRDSQWPQGDIDRFILAALEAKGLTPAPQADPQSLLRRLYIDLTGLPPMPKQIDAFVADPSPKAYARLVDELLSSPQYGERWGRHWLDVARFAESSGGGRSLMFRNAWRFRDYVIDSFNADKPFNQLIREHIAGDLLPYKSPEERNANLIGVGYLILGPHSYEQQDKALLKMDVVDEQISAVGSTFLGMTLGCVRCHSHKFDPIPIEDYYALAGIFHSTNSLTPGNVSGYIELALSGNAKLEKELADYQKKIGELTLALQVAKKEYQRVARKPLPVANSNAGAARPASSKRFAGIVIDDVAAKKVGYWKKSVFHKGYIDAGYIHDDSKDRGKKSVVFAPKIEIGGQYEVRFAYTPGGNRASNVPVTIDHQDGRAEVTVNQSQTPSIDDRFVSLGTYRFEADTVAQVTVTNKGTNGVVIVDAVQFLPTGAKSKTAKPTKRSVKKASAREAKKIDDLIDQKPGKPTRVAKAKKSSDSDNAAALKKRYEQLNKQLKALKAKAPKAKEKAMSVRDKTKPADGHVHIRGQVRTKGKLVPRGFLTVASAPGKAAPKIADGQSGRMELAQWVADPDNPLTARVMVNRIWLKLMGEGIVRTPDNFGYAGLRPSHPMLLDYLANQFIADGWSIKKLIRRILLSRTYRLATVHPDAEKVVKVDPENTLLSHAHRRRLDAEVIRDSILQVSGKLDSKMGGLTIVKFSQYDLGYKHGDINRRSVYVPAFRNSLLEIFEIFDYPNPNLVTGRRTASTIAPQSLYLMNSPFVIRQAQFAAEALLAIPKLDQSARVEYAYRQVLGRRPSNDELKNAKAYLSSYGGKDRDAFGSLYHTLFASLDFRYLN